MNQYLLLAGIVIVACVLLHRFAEKLPVPSLLIFIALGMFFGKTGLWELFSTNTLFQKISVLPV